MESVLSRALSSDTIQVSERAIQKKVDAAVGGFVQASTDWRSIAALSAGGLAYRWGRLGIMGSGANSALRMVSVGLGFTAEVSTFELTQRFLNSENRNSWKWSGTGGLRQGLLQSFVTFGALKGAGHLARGENLIAQHLLQDTAMVLGYQLSGHLRLAPRPEESLAEQFLHAEATNLQLAAGVALAHGMAPGLHGLERGLDLSLRGRNVPHMAQWEKGWNDLSFLGEPALVTGPKILFVESKGNEKHFLSAMTGTGRDSSPPPPPVVESVDPGVSAAEAKIEFPPALIEALRKAKRVTVLTGAGLSAESGIPTFRDGAAALWANVSMDEVATPEAFAKDPGKVWRWHAEQFRRFLSAQPNEAHRALAEMEKRFPEFTLITQNIDGLHQEAGSKNVVELHGSLLRARCPQEDRVVDLWEEGAEPPSCPHCSAPLRPDVVWFKEQLPPEALNAAFQATEGSEVFFSIGTSSLINPAAALARRAVLRRQTVVEINPNETALTPVASFSLRGPAGKLLPALIEAVWTSQNSQDPIPGSAEDLTQRYLPHFRGNFGEQTVSTILATEERFPSLHESLLKAFSEQPASGSLNQLYTALALKDLFYADASGSSTSLFDAALLQTFIRSASADTEGPRRNQAFKVLFRLMEEGLTREALVNQYKLFGYGVSLRVSEGPLYPAQYSKGLGETRSLLKNYRPQDIIPLLNLVYELAPTDLPKARRLVRVLAVTRQSRLYDPAQIDEVLDEARSHPVGTLLLKRMLQVLLSEEPAMKLEELIDKTPRKDTFEAILELQSKGLSSEEIAAQLNGSSHTAYLKDLRLARKVVSMTTQIQEYLRPGHGERLDNHERLKALFNSYMDQGLQLEAPQLLDLLEVHAKEDGYPLARRMREMRKSGELQIRVVSGEEFDAWVAASPALEGCELLFFLQSEKEGEPHQIIIRELPEFSRGTRVGRALGFRETIRRVKLLAHEGTHLLQALGLEESIAHGSPPFDFSAIDKEERLSSEMIAFMEQTVWDVKNTDIEYWIRSRRLGLNLALYFFHINDQNYFGGTNEWLMSKVTERP